MKQRGVIARRSSAAAVGSSSGHDGLIAFMRPGTVGEFDLWTVRPDGRRLQRLTESLTNRSDYNPTWLPDGATVLFGPRFLNGGTDSDDLHTVRPNGTGPHQLTDCSGNCWGDGEASWLPDGKHIAFGRATGPRTIDHPTKIAVYLANPDGSTIRQLTRPPAGYEDHYPTAGPAAATYRRAIGKFAFVSTEASTPEVPTTHIVTVSQDGTGRTDLTPNSTASELQPDWSLTGGRSCSRARATETARST